MKKSSVFLTVGVGVALTGLAIFVASKFVKKQEEKEAKRKEEEKKEEINNLSELSLPEETLVRIIENREGGFTEKIHRLLRHSPRWSDDYIDLERYIKPGCGNAIHVSQSLYNNKTPQLDIYLVVPEYVKKSYAFPKIGEFKSCLDNLSRGWRCHPFTMLELWAVVVDKEGKEPDDQKIIRINPEYYKDKSSQKNDGTKEYYELLIRNNSSEQEKLEEYLGTSVVEIALLWRISFRMKTESYKEGIDLAEAARVLKSLVETEITGSNGTSVEYDIIVFHSSVPTEETLSRRALSMDLLALDGTTYTVGY